MLLVSGDTRNILSDLCILFCGAFFSRLSAIMTMSKGLEKVASFMFDVSSVTALTSFSLAMMMMGKSNLKQLKVGV